MKELSVESTKSANIIYGSRSAIPGRGDVPAETGVAVMLT